MGKVNGLSRRPDLKVGVKNDNENQKLIERVRGKNKEVVRIIEGMKKVVVRVLRGEKWEIEEDLVLKEEKMYILKDEELRLEY